MKAADAMVTNVIAVGPDARLRFAKDGNADLIVAGASGHSRSGEWMFGGATHELLAKSQLCCLCSH